MGWPRFPFGVISLLWVFETPTVDVGFPYVESGRPTGLVFHTSRGVTVLRVNGVWSEMQSPDEQTVSSAERVYVGGYMNVVSDGEKAELAAAGYGDQITRLSDQVVDVVEDVLQ